MSLAVVTRLAVAGRARSMQLTLHARKHICTSAIVRKNAETMKQVEVDEPHVQSALGQIQMNLVKQAEKQNLDRAERHRKFRRKDWMVGLTCFAIVVGIYCYTIFAIKQEQFLDDFDMPDPTEETPQDKLNRQLARKGNR